MINSNKLKGKMREMGITQSDIANSLKISQCTANQKLNNVRSMSLDEANAIAQLLNISPMEFGGYFFAQ